MLAIQSRIRKSLETLMGRIESVAADAGRGTGGVGLIAVTKYSTGIETAAVAKAMQELGLPVRLGESRVQDLLQKFPVLEEEGLAPELHFIGNLQRNKARSVALHAACVHSVDRDAIANRLSELAVEGGRVLPCLVQVRLSTEPNKHGYSEQELAAALERIAKLKGLEVRGLMGMAERGTDHETARPYFARLRELRDQVAADLPELSMGMSQDFEGAIREGATLLRIGSLLFKNPEAGR